MKFTLLTTFQAVMTTCYNLATSRVALEASGRENDRMTNPRRVFWSLTAALLTLIFQALVSDFESITAVGIFCGMMVLPILWVKLAVTETKRCPLEQIEHHLGFADS
ncbi:MAG: hypothetical protein WBE58_02860 [Verrucomicrobiales bacterium]